TSRGWELMSGRANRTQSSHKPQLAPREQINSSRVPQEETSAEIQYKYTGRIQTQVLQFLVRHPEWLAMAVYPMPFGVQRFQFLPERRLPICQRRGPGRPRSLN